MCNLNLLKLFIIMFILGAWCSDSYSEGKLTTVIFDDGSVGNLKGKFEIDIIPSNPDIMKVISCELDSRAEHIDESNNKKCMFKFVDENVICATLKSQATLKDKNIDESFFYDGINILVPIYKQNNDIKLYVPIVKLRAVDSLIKIPNNRLPKDIGDEKRLWGYFQIARGESKRRMGLIKDYNEISVNTFICFYRFLQYADFLGDTHSLKIDDDEVISQVSGYIKEVLDNRADILDNTCWSRKDIEQLLSSIEESRLRFAGRLYNELIKDDENGQCIECIQRNCTYLSQLLDNLGLRHDNSNKLAKAAKIDLSHFETVIANCLIKQAKNAKYKLKENFVPEEIMARIKEQVNNLQRAATKTQSIQMKHIALRHKKVLKNFIVAQRN